MSASRGREGEGYAAPEPLLTPGRNAGSAGDERGARFASGFRAGYCANPPRGAPRFGRRRRQTPDRTDETSLHRVVQLLTGGAGPTPGRAAMMSRRVDLARKPLRLLLLLSDLQTGPGCKGSPRRCGASAPT
jgi:hypothetical protein